MEACQIILYAKNSKYQIYFTNFMVDLKATSIDHVKFKVKNLEESFKILQKSFWI